MVWERAPTFPRVPMSPVTLRDLEEQTRTFDRLGGINMGIGGGPLLEAPDGTLQSVDRQFVTARFFDALGVRADRGPDVPAGGSRRRRRGSRRDERGTVAHTIRRRSIAHRSGRPAERPAIHGHRDRARRCATPASGAHLVVVGAGRQMHCARSLQLAGHGPFKS